jgi:hypothetical protein
VRLVFLDCQDAWWRGLDLQATALGLHTRGMAGFSPEQLYSALKVADGVQRLRSPCRTA